MANKSNKFNDQKIEIPKKVIEKPEVPKINKLKYLLIKDVSIDGEVKKKGTFVELTQKGKEYFKQQFYIK